MTTDRRRTTATDETPAITDFDDWYRREARRVAALVYTLSGSRGAAEEITQDAFLEAHRQWGAVAQMTNPGGWVRAVAMNKSRSRLRRRAAEARAYTKHLGRQRSRPEEMPEPADHFWAAVRALPTQQAKCVALHYLEDRSVDDIAEILEISLGSVKTHLSRARAALATTLGTEEDA
jgi:RNA polymerase sigma-70 factor (ECF subfamily)